MLPHKDFSIHDDNFWTNAFRLCSDSGEREDKDGEAAEAPVRPSLTVNGEEEKREDSPSLAYSHWDCSMEDLHAVEDTETAPNNDDNYIRFPPNSCGGFDGVGLMSGRRTSPFETRKTTDMENEEEGERNGSRKRRLSWESVRVESGEGIAAASSVIAPYPVMDDKYMEYFEFLSNGFNRLLDDFARDKASLRSLMDTMTCPFEGKMRLPNHSASVPSLEGDPPSARLSSPSLMVDKSAIGCRALSPKLYHQFNPGTEIYSRKVFVGGLPLETHEHQLFSLFSPFGPLTVDWPNKQERWYTFPPKGYVFLIFHFESSVRLLVDSCIAEDDKLFFRLAPHKLVQVRPWKLADSDYIVDVNMRINPRRVIFVGGVPRPIRAVELAHLMDKLYGSVVCAGIDTDLEFKYPKGAGRVAFMNENSYIRAISDRYAQLSHGERVRVEMKPYVLDDQSCDECLSARYAPFFCPSLECLQYYCESCWTCLHSSPLREHHKPLVKEA